MSVTSTHVPVLLHESIQGLKIQGGGTYIDCMIDSQFREIDVRRVGLERWFFNLAHEQPLIYGILALFLAIFFGWGASALFRYIRP